VTNRVAVIDIGSNSIKLLVGERAPTSGVHAVATRGIDARISAGISREQAQLGEEGMTRGLEAIRSLLLTAAEHRPDQTVLVATSAVRDARNGGEFAHRILAATGHEVRILTGEEEAALIGRGLVTDPGLGHLEDFRVFDLGGGSLECLAFRARRIECAVSFPLGCVRMTERFIPDPSAPISADALAAIAAHTHATVAAGFAPRLSAGAAAVATGGTIATLLRVFARHEGPESGAVQSLVEVRRARALMHEIAALPLSVRREFPGLPAARADVFPAALATLLAVAEHGSITAFHHSMHNLRHGLADALLAAESA
jgi:exopolyphosphatase/guanosine-5'-triphosphate,3'-diphosphate pyrophosphatase